MSPDYFHVQPIYGANGSLLFGEVLSRWKDMDTQEAILKAEAEGYIHDIDMCGIEFGLSAAIPVSCNISSKTIQGSQLLRLANRVREGLICEITETYPPMLDRIRTFAFEVHARGGSISLDDVGSGYFNKIPWLKKIIEAARPQWLKMGIDTPPEFIEFCQRTNIPVVLEKVETRENLEYALELGVTGLQGWFFDSEPGVQWLHQQRRPETQIAYRELEMAQMALAA